MAQPHITARRSSVTIDADWLEPAVLALESGTELAPTPDMSGGTRRLAEFISQHNGPDPRYAPLARVPKRPRQPRTRRSSGFVLMLGNTPLRDDTDDTDSLITPTDYMPAYAEFWQFDHDGTTSGHIFIANGSRKTRLTVTAFRNNYQCGTSSRSMPGHTLQPFNSGRHIYESDTAAWTMNKAALSDYVFGDDTALGSGIGTMNPRVLSSAANVRTADGPAVRDRVWERELPTPGTDLNFDAAYPDGLHATYRVYRKK